MGKMNLAVNRLLQRKSIYADLMNGTIFNGQQNLTEDDLEWIPEESGIFYRNEKGKTRALERRGDVRMRSETGTFSLIFATESEDKVHYGMPVKNMLYEALEYMKQIQDIEKAHREKSDWENGDEFLSGISNKDKLIPIITIVLYTGNKGAWDGPRSLMEMYKLSDDEKILFRDFLPDYKIHLVNVYDINNPELFQTALKPIFFMLRYREDKEKLYQYLQDNREDIQKMDNVEKMAAYVLLGEQKRMEKLIAKNSSDQGNNEEVIDMCKAIDDLIMDGEKRGTKNTLIENVKSLMSNLGFTSVQAMDALNIPKTDRDLILKSL